MSTINYKEAAINDVTDSLEILKAIGRTIRENKTDKDSVISNLIAAITKLERSLEYIRQK